MNLRTSLQLEDISLRQFACSEMGISYHSLWSLVRKPRPWYKLRTRARKMYRRMHQWVQMVENKKSIKELVESALTEQHNDDETVLSNVFNEEIGNKSVVKELAKNREWLSKT